MSAKAAVTTGLIIGGLIGSAIASALGMGIFSYSSVLVSSIGSLIGIWAGWKLSGN